MKPTDILNQRLVSPPVLTSYQAADLLETNTDSYDYQVDFVPL